MEAINLKTLPGIIRAYRKKRGWSQTELGKAAGGLHFNTISSFERGAGGLSLESLVAICKALDIRLWVDPPRTYQP